MEKVALVVPVFKNFPGFAELIHSVDYPIVPIVIPNWIKNMGVSKAWNRGIERANAAGCEATVICNDDVTFEPGTIKKLIESLEEYDLVTGINRRDVPNSYGLPPFKNEPDFSCFAIKTHTFPIRFGHFDERFTPAYFEDNDMHYRIKLRGGRAVCRTDAGMYHKGSVTQNWGGEQFVIPAMFEENRFYYIRKWGGPPGAERFDEPFGRKV